MKVKSKYNNQEIIPAFTSVLARNVLAKSGACSFIEEYSSHFCEIFGEIIFPSMKVAGNDENGKLIGEVIVCERCGSVDINEVKFN